MGNMLVDGHHLVTQVTDLTLQPSPLDADEEVGPKILGIFRCTLLM